ncbi:MAG: FxLYD domain-containing protein [Candidatus Bathyarchaeia archaeon]
MRDSLIIKIDDLLFVVSRKVFLIVAVAAIIIASVAFVEFQTARVSLPNTTVSSSQLVESGEVARIETPTPTGPLLELRSGKFYEEGGFKIAEGQVTNLGREPLVGVIAVVDFKADQQIVNTVRVPIAFNPLMPGETSPFKVRTSPRVAINLAEFEFEQRSAGIIPISDVRNDSTVFPNAVVSVEKPKLELRGFIFSVEEIVQSSKSGLFPAAQGTLTFLVVRGEVANISSEKLDNVMAVATFYSADGKFVKWAQTPFPLNPILPGQTSTFEILTLENSEAITAFVEFQELDGGTLPTSFQSYTRVDS